jgi:hypothetical protein
MRGKLIGAALLLVFAGGILTPSKSVIHYAVHLKIRACDASSTHSISGLNHSAENNLRHFVRHFKGLSEALNIKENSTGFARTSISILYKGKELPEEVSNASFYHLRGPPII